MKITDIGGRTVFVRDSDVADVSNLSPNHGWEVVMRYGEGVAYHVTESEARRIIAACGLDDEPVKETTSEPGPLTIEAGKWYVTWRGDVVCVTHKSRGGWGGTFVLRTGEFNGYARFDDLGNATSGPDRPRNKIVRPHVGPLPWETPA